MEIELDESSIYFFFITIQTTTDNIRTLTYTFSIAASHLVGDILSCDMIQTSTESFLNSPSPVTTQLSEICRFFGFRRASASHGRIIEDNECGQRGVNFSRMSKSEWKKKRGRLRCGRRPLSELGWEIPASERPRQCKYCIIIIYNCKIWYIFSADFLASKNTKVLFIGLYYGVR